MKRQGATLQFLGASGTVTVVHERLGWSTAVAEDGARVALEV